MNKCRQARARVGVRGRLLVLLLAGMAVCNASADDLELALPDNLESRIMQWAEPLVREGQLSGRVLVARGDSEPVVLNFGLANRELSVPMSMESRFNVASVTKPMTQIAMAALIADGKLSLEDTIDRWLPDFPQADVITVRMLVFHEAGVPHRLMDEILETQPSNAEEMTERAASQDLDYEPGTDSNYSSGGYSVLARVMELASGESYEALLQKHVFEPAGMTHSAHVTAATVMPGRVDSYLPSPSGAFINAPFKDLSFLVGAGSVWSTVEDLHAMVNAIRDGSFGPMVQSSLIRESGFRSNGLTSGFRAWADWYSDSDTTVTFTGNLTTGATTLLREAVPRLADGEDVSRPEVPSMQPFAVEPAALEELTGDYQLGPNRTLSVSPRDGGLQISGWILIPTGPDTYVSPQDYGLVRVVRDDEGVVTGLAWTTNGQTSDMPRVGNKP
ncbi:MAG: serine hydrolase domain-containing protein [Pseudomonadota bacterium]